MARRTAHRLLVAAALSLSTAGCAPPSSAPSFAPNPSAARVKAAAPGELRPAGGRHVVRAGETLDLLARRYGVSVGALTAANGLAPPYTIRVGQELSLPRGGADRAQTYVVRPGDTLSSIAARFNTTVRALAVASDIADPDHVVAGQTLVVLPDALVPRRPSPPRATVSTGPALLPPVQGGEVVAGFAEAGGGVEIAAEARAPVRAAADGVVLYAGPGPGAPAGVVLLRHDDGGVGVYARTGDVFVGQGDRVRRGAVIARLPDGERPRLRFELREDGRKVDPSRRLSPVAQAAGLEIDAPAAVEIAAGEPATNGLAANGLGADERAADAAPSLPLRPDAAAPNGPLF